MYTIKMSKKTDKRITNYFDFVVPPLEWFWWQDGIKRIDYSHKEKFSWISLIRLPEFVQKEDIKWAISEASKKKKLDYSKIEILHYKEGLSVQCMHIGPYNNEVETVEKMDKYIEEKGYKENKKIELNLEKKEKLNVIDDNESKDCTTLLLKNA